jgi:hypothetical protein
VVWVRRSGDELVGEIEASERVHRWDFEGVGQIEIRKQARDAHGEHGFADTGRAVEEHVVPAGSGYLACPLGLHLTDHIRQVEMTIGVSAGALSDDLDRLDWRHLNPPQEGDPERFSFCRLRAASHW